MLQNHLAVGRSSPCGSANCAVCQTKSLASATRLRVSTSGVLLDCPCGRKVVIFSSNVWEAVNERCYSGFEHRRNPIVALARPCKSCTSSPMGNFTSSMRHFGNVSALSDDHGTRQGLPTCRCPSRHGNRLAFLRRQSTLTSGDYILRVNGKARSGLMVQDYSGILCLRVFVCNFCLRLRRLRLRVRSYGCCAPSCASEGGLFPWHLPQGSGLWRSALCAIRRCCIPRAAAGHSVFKL